jgi:hypothetical protein
MPPPGMAGASFFFGVSATDAAFLQRDTHDLRRSTRSAFGGAVAGWDCTHWKAPRHGAHIKRTFEIATVDVAVGGKIAGRCA